MMKHRKKTREEGLISAIVERFRTYLKSEDKLMESYLFSFQVDPRDSSKETTLGRKHFYLLDILGGI